MDTNVGAEEQSRPGLAGRIVNEELKRFSEISASTPNIELVSAKNAVVAGEHFGSFDFSCLSMERREEIRSILQQWFDFKRSIEGKFRVPCPNRTSSRRPPLQCGL